MEYLTAVNSLSEVLARAYRLDDKPHLLFSVIRNIAINCGEELGFVQREIDEIVKLCDIAYVRASKLIEDIDV